MRNAYNRIVFDAEIVPMPSHPLQAGSIESRYKRKGKKGKKNARRTEGKGSQYRVLIVADYPDWGNDGSSVKRD